MIHILIIKRKNKCTMFLLIEIIFGLVWFSLTIISLIIMVSRIILRRKGVFDSECTKSSKYKPVVCIHGLLEPSYSLDIFVEVIRTYHPGTDVTVIHLYNGCKSLTSLWQQIEEFKAEVEKISAQYPQGIHLVGLSQGTIIARGILETSDKHNVDTYISVAGPQMGQYGLTILQKIPGFTWVIKNLYRFFYTDKYQKYSVPEFWKDPYHMDLYKAMNTFLPMLNNEVYHPRMEEFKKNLLQIKRMVLIGSPQDGCITPWQSSHFGYYDEKGNIVDMKNQDAYQNDTFGLRSLDERGAITMVTVPGVYHQYFAIDIPVIKQYVLPYLT